MKLKVTMNEKMLNFKSHLRKLKQDRTLVPNLPPMTFSVFCHRLMELSSSDRQFLDLRYTWRQDEAWHSLNKYLLSMSHNSKNGHQAPQQAFANASHSLRRTTPSSECVIISPHLLLKVKLTMAKLPKQLRPLHTHLLPHTYTDPICMAFIEIALKLVPLPCFHLPFTPTLSPPCFHPLALHCSEG